VRPRGAAPLLGEVFRKELACRFEESIGLVEELTGRRLDHWRR